MSRIFQLQHKSKENLDNNNSDDFLPAEAATIRSDLIGSSQLIKMSKSFQNFQRMSFT